MEFIVYKTTNLVNGHYYIGVHKQEADDRYLGSGVGLRRAIKFYGREKFQRETLHTFDSLESAYAKEIECLKEVYNTEECYNMHPGGRGTRKARFDSHSPEWCANHSKLLTGKKQTEERKAHMRIKMLGNTSTPKGFKFSEERNAKIRATKAATFAEIRAAKAEKKLLKGKGPGMRWWNDGTKSTQSRQCPEGWSPGRISACA